MTASVLNAAGRRPAGGRQLSVPALICCGGLALVVALCLLAAWWPSAGAGRCLQPSPADAARIQRVAYSAITNSSDGGSSAGVDGTGGGSNGGGVREDRSAAWPRSNCSNGGTNALCMSHQVASIANL